MGTPITIYQYDGTFTQRVIEGMHEEIVNNPLLQSNRQLLKTLVFIAIELAQNIQRYSADKIKCGITWTGKGFLSIEQTENGVKIKAKNHIEKEVQIRIKTTVKKLNSLDEDSLKELSKQQKKAEAPTNSVGAGLGLIEMRRKSGNPIELEFIENENNFTLLCITITI